MIQSSKLVPGKAFNVKSEIPVSDVDAYFGQMEVDCRALHPVKFSAILVNKGEFITLEADVETEIEYVCDRCGGSFARPCSMHISLRLAEASKLAKSDEIDLSEDDLDVVTFIAPNIDLEHILLESIYLEMDDPCLCREDCPGMSEISQ